MKKKVKNLVIVESPAKAKTINKFLGSDYQVESCFGHIKDLPKNELGVDVDNGFKPTYVVIPGKKKIINKLRKLSKEAEKIFLATDMDREGEAISWHLSQELNHKKKLRVVFNQVTKKALQEAITNPGQIDINKVDAQQGRRILDRLVGYKLSPLLWEKVKRGLSAGRVQSVAVRLLCEREDEIEAFTPKEYWSISVIFRDDRKRKLEASLYQISGEKPEIGDEKSAQRIAKDIRKGEYKVAEVKKTQIKNSPYPPFITSTLQQAASSHLRFSPAKTMKIAQDLYEGQDIGADERVGLITYMRTDSTRVAREAQLATQEWIEKNLGKEFVPKKVPVYKNKKTSQDAHEAIRPTRVDLTPDMVKNYLSPDHYKLYDLIWRRFVASQMVEAVIDKVSVDIQGTLSDKKELRFKAEGRWIRFPGFMKVYQEKSEKDKTVAMPEVGVILKVEKIVSRQHFTQPPPHYTEATLVKALEEKGIGRPSTYAPIISTIQQRGYVRWVRGKLIPTPLARVVNALLVSNFATIIDTNFTARMEEGLDEVEQGKKKWTYLVEEFYQRFKKDLEKAEATMRNIKEDGLIPSSAVCEKCGSKMVVKIGKFGEFLACSNYPKCKNTKPLDHKIGMKCPVPGCGGELVEKLTKKNRSFYACSRYPDCKFLTWEQPVDDECPNCANPYLVKAQSGGLKCPKCGEKVKNTIIKEIDLEGVRYEVVKLRRVPHAISY